MSTILVTSEMMTRFSAIRETVNRMAQEIAPYLWVETDYGHEFSEVLRFEITAPAEVTLEQMTRLAEVFGTRDIRIQPIDTECFGDPDYTETRVELVLRNAVIP